MGTGLGQLRSVLKVYYLCQNITHTIIDTHIALEMQWSAADQEGRGTHQSTNNLWDMLLR